MKAILHISFLVAISIICACKKTNNAPSKAALGSVVSSEKFGPYGKVSQWESIGGDTLFAEKLTLTYFYTEKHSPCNICYYQQNISFWNDYDYTFSISECAVVSDTLIFTDIDSGKKAIFKRDK
jgi:hypothetical protein